MPWVIYKPAKLDLDHPGLDGRICVWTGSYYESEAKASLIFFRNDSSPFRQEDLETIDVVSNLLGRQLGGLERIELRAQPEEEGRSRGQTHGGGRSPEGARWIATSR